MKNAKVTEVEVRKFIAEWFVKLDEHAPVKAMLPLLLDGELVMRFPEGTVTGHAGFTRWYEACLNQYFDEKHILHASSIVPNGNSAEVKLVVQWQHREWQSGAARTTFHDHFAAQTWRLRRLPATHKLGIVEYNVDYYLTAIASAKSETPP